ncbi:vWA domain-containing protein [Arenimonas alkanexedens]
MSRYPRRTATSALALLCLATGLAHAQAPAREQAIIVLDASGSMWGQIDGKPKLQIARDTLATVLKDMPANMELGLIAYGHREKGNCDDIELVVPVAAGSGADIAAAAASMKFMGMTPLSAAVAQAASELRSTEQKATVILITDGLETCKADPCALGRELEASGVDFTAHVVGFGLSAEEGKQVACLAENTGGRYIAANDADSLAAALNETVVEAPPAVVVPEATLEAPESVPMSSRFLVTWTGPAEQYDDVQIFDPKGRAGSDQVIDSARIPSDERFEQKQVELVAPAKPGDYVLRYYHGAQAKVIATRPITVIEAEVTLDAPAEVSIASRFDVTWTGPGEQYDDVRIWNRRDNAGRGGVVDGQRVQSAPGFEQRQVSLNAPAVPGDYELQYYNGDNSAVLATVALKVVDAEVMLEAPEQVDMASSFTVTWTGPGAAYDEVQVWNPRAEAGRGATLDTQRVQSDEGFDQRQVSLTAPATPGDYELRYYNGDNRKVLATVPLLVVEVEVALDAPASVPMASDFSVTWTGPGAAYDEVQVWNPRAEAGRGATLDTQRVQSDEGFDQRQVTMTAPATPGDYELRYYNGDSRKLLATVPLQVAAIDVALDAPASVPMASVFSVTWTGPGAAYDEVQVWNPRAQAGRGASLDTQRVQSDKGYDQRQVTMTAPATPGDYLLRYWNGTSRVLLHEQPLAVTAVPVGLDAPARAGAGTALVVTWTGPGAAYDEVQVWNPRAQAGRGEVVTSGRVQSQPTYEQRQVSLTLPKVPGEYALRYWNGQDRILLHTQPLTVE